MRVPTGIPGLDELIEGGIRANTVTVIVGASGTGKTTFVMQFVLHGLENGEQGLYISLEEKPEQLIEEAKLMGWDLRKYVDKSLYFYFAAGSDFKDLVESDLPQLVESRTDYEVPTRVVIDPLTPFIWEVSDKRDQRLLISNLFGLLKKVGPVICSVEEHLRPGETIGEDVLIPIYLADGVLHLQYQPIGGAFNRTLEIMKMRGTRHGEEVYPFMMARGVGVIVRSSTLSERVAETIKGTEDYEETFQRAIQTAVNLKAPENLIRKLKIMQENWMYEYSPEEALRVLFRYYNLHVG